MSLWCCVMVSIFSMLTVLMRIHHGKSIHLASSVARALGYDKLGAYHRVARSVFLLVRRKEGDALVSKECRWLIVMRESIVETVSFVCGLREGSKLTIDRLSSCCGRWGEDTDDESDVVDLEAARSCYFDESVVEDCRSKSGANDR